MFGQFLSVVLMPLSLLQIVFGSIGVAWLSWRFWQFTILPSLKPKEPREYPYWIPFIGHAVAFMKDTESLYSRARTYFGNTRAPFALKVAGTTLYIVTATQDVPIIYRNTVSLSFDEYIRDTVLAIGASKPSVDKLFRSAEEIREIHGIELSIEKSLISEAKSYYAQQFLPGPKLKDFWPVFQSGIESYLHLDRLPHRAVQYEDGSKVRVSLLTWVRETLMNAATDAVFGPQLLKIRPDLMDVFTRYDDESWKMNYQVPPAFCPEFTKNKLEVVAALKQYFSLPSSERQGEMWFVRSLERQMRQLELPLDDIACFFLMPLWVTNSNAYKSSFWLLAHILYDQDLYKIIKSETDTALAQGHENLAERLDECPHLMALWQEVLRYYAATASVRTVESDMKLGPYELKKGGRVLVPYHQLHIDESAFGNNAHEFHAERFLQRKELGKSPSYRPFGGGITYCSGRIVARWEVFTFVALVLNRFQLKIVTDIGADAPSFPVRNAQTPTLGVMPPTTGQDVYIEVSNVL